MSDFTLWEIGDQVRWQDGAGEWHKGRIVGMFTELGGNQNCVIREHDGKATGHTLAGSALRESHGPPTGWTVPSSGDLHVS